jgi:ABC-2 type transport system ATP-binding protein
MNAIETVDLTRRFGRLEAVAGLSMQVPTGSVFALVGPNGAGKTTTIKLLMGLLRPTRGSATLLGVNSTRLGTNTLQRIGYVSENQRLPGHLSAAGLLDYCRPFYPTWDDSLSKRLRRTLNLPMQEPISGLSRGTRMKAALLSALAFRPALLILDEPFSGLDPLVRDELVHALLELANEQPWTVLISSHDIEEVERLADWVGFINGGQLIFAEPVSLLLQRFRLVEVIGTDEAPAIVREPAWVAEERAGRTVRFIDTAHDGADAHARIASAYPGVEIRTASLSLRDIFVVLARQATARSPRRGARMTLLAHLLMADVGRLRFVLAIWLVLVAANRVVEGGGALFAADPNLRESFAVLASVLWLAELLLAFVLVSLVVHAHPTVGSDAFWLTRPIPRRLVLTSKLSLLTTALVVVPAIADAVLLATHNVPTSIAAGVIAQIASIDTIWLLLVVVAAALTANLMRFAMLIGAALLSSAVAIGIFVAVTLARLSDEASSDGVLVDSGASGLVVFNVVFVFAVLAMLAVQYETRSRRRSLAVGVAGVVVAYLVSSLWPVAFLSPRLIVPDWARDERVVTVAVDTETIATNTQHMFYPGQRRQWSTVNGRVRVGGLQPGWTASVVAHDASVQLPGGETLRSAGGSRSSLVWLDDGGMQPSAAIRTVLGVARIATAIPPVTEPRSQNYPSLFLMEQTRLGRYAPVTGEYRARIRVTLTHHTIDGTLPLRPGETHQNGGYRLVLDSISHMNGDISLIARESRAASVWERRPRSSYTFYLRNRVREEALEVSEYQLRGAFTLMQFLPFAGVGVGQHYGNGFHTRALALTFPPRYGPRAETVEADAEWLAGAELVIVRRTEEGSVERAVAIPAFPLGHARQVSTLP